MCARRAIESVIFTQWQRSTENTRTIPFASFGVFEPPRRRWVRVGGWVNEWLFFFASVLELLLRQNKTRTIKINMKHSILLNALKLAGAKNKRVFTSK